jgi:hypothetical protein
VVSSKPYSSAFRRRLGLGIEHPWCSGLSCLYKDQGVGVGVVPSWQLDSCKCLKTITGTSGIVRDGVGF